MVNVSKFIKDNTPLSVCTLIVVILGCLGCHAVQWVINKCHKTEKIDRVAQKSIGVSSEISSPSSNNTRSKPRHNPKHLLSDALFEEAKPYVDIPSNLRGIPQASSGKTPVYLPKELPIVLKASGSPENQKRFDQMKQGRDICEQSGYENLVIPKARVYGNFIVESRLPITTDGTKEQIGFYIENHERFACAVKEFIGFLCQSSLDDITGGTNDPYQTLSKTPMGRYDNIALYLEKDQGKIGLIDLEQFEPGCDKWGEKWCFCKCQTAVYLFPLHLDEIMSVAKRFDSNIDTYRGDLELAREETLKYFKLAYGDHLDFIKEKKIALENPLEIVEINPVRKENIKESVVVAIRKEHDDVSYKNCLGEKPEEVIALFEKSFPKILDLTTSFLSEILKKEIKGPKKAISSYPQLLSCRTLFFSSDSKEYTELKGKVASELQMMRIEEWYKRSFASKIIQGVFKELAKGREIAYYNPYFGIGGRIKQCIFC